jgi:flagellum-specific peptidoglycan hydrolase FlgJ
MTPKEFIKKYQDEIIISTIGTSILPSVKMAQACLETGFGASFVGPAKNLFGIKAYGDHTPYWKGDFVESATGEVFSGVSTVINDKFRKYKTVTDSIRDHSYFLTHLDRYKPVLKAKTPEAQAKALQSCGYATATHYSDALIRLIKDYNLTKLDKRKKVMKYVKLSLAVAALALVILVIYENVK